jgi:type II secretory pathway component GspD/PulD (secretin)
MRKIIAGLFLLTFTLTQAGAAQLTSSGGPASTQLAKDQIQLDCYVVEIKASDDRFGALHWPHALDQGSAKFGLTGSVGAASDAMFPEHAFFSEGVILADQVAKAKIRELVQRGKLTNLTVTDTQSGEPVQIGNREEHTYFLQTAATANTPYTFTTGLTIGLVPRILPGGVIGLKINPAFSAQTGSTQSPAILGTDTTVSVPVIATGSATAEVKLRSGEAAVIGGLTREVNYTSNNVPGLRNIPLLDHLFEARAGTTERTNTVIIVWARIPDKTVQQGPVGQLPTIKTVGS